MSVPESDLAAPSHSLSWTAHSDDDDGRCSSWYPVCNCVCVCSHGVGLLPLFPPSSSPLSSVSMTYKTLCVSVDENFPSSPRVACLLLLFVSYLLWHGPCLWLFTRREEFLRRRSGSLSREEGRKDVPPPPPSQQRSAAPILCGLFCWFGSLWLRVFFFASSHTMDESGLALSLSLWLGRCHWIHPTVPSPTIPQIWGGKNSEGDNSQHGAPVRRRKFPELASGDSFFHSTVSISPRKSSVGLSSSPGSSNLSLLTLSFLPFPPTGEGGVFPCPPLRFILTRREAPTKYGWCIFLERKLWWPVTVDHVKGKEAG